ncbi:hypothetical protein PCANC_11194 [Puccinia coronata f. sp. avenae]|uniref:Uncharacterized protein n=1 Tax=Puccinia coronata f. sp. avenae TaxID=200324 RepID=A0A2N5T3B6_9BASI|nr:hypothetical protein PCANC_10172 [Puccinia coronata f. sp. avenae]PLW46323.1 hypothetical protein PCANC_11194 [Puccinia coronata f. sp. avenae]
MNMPQATHQQTQPPPPENAPPPAEAPQHIEDKGTPSKASEVLGKVRLSPFELGDAIGVVPTADRGLQLIYCVTRPALPGGGINKYQHPHIHQYRKGNKLLAPSSMSSGMRSKWPTAGGPLRPLQSITSQIRTRALETKSELPRRPLRSHGKALYPITLGMIAKPMQ